MVQNGKQIMACAMASGYTWHTQHDFSQIYLIVKFQFAKLLNFDSFARAKSVYFLKANNVVDIEFIHAIMHLTLIRCTTAPWHSTMYHGFRVHFCAMYGLSLLTTMRAKASQDNIFTSYLSIRISP